MKALFLSIEAIRKQLFHEFLAYERLALPPDESPWTFANTLLSSPSKGDTFERFSNAEVQLKTLVSGQDKASEKNQFETLLTAYFKFVRASETGSNPFVDYVQKNKGRAVRPCAWMRFAPLWISGDAARLSFKTKDELTAFLNTMNHNAIGFRPGYAIEETGLYIAVQTANHEMVEAFLCEPFFHYQLSAHDLKTLLGITTDAKTRLALLRSSPELLSYMANDDDLKMNVINSVEELEGLHKEWSAEQCLTFIQASSTQLWMNLLKQDAFFPQKVQRLLGQTAYAFLQDKLMNDEIDLTHDKLLSTLSFLDDDKQYAYLLHYVPMNDLYPLPIQAKDERFEAILASLGYPKTNTGERINQRYFLDETVRSTHDAFIRTLVTLPIDATHIIEALQLMEYYIKNPGEAHQTSLNASIQNIDEIVSKRDRETAGLIGKILYWLADAFKISMKKPISPYVQQVIDKVGTTKLNVIPGEVLRVLPIHHHHRNYQPALTALMNQQIKLFWEKLPSEVQHDIITNPIQLERLFNYLSAPQDNRQALIDSLDKTSLEYLSTLDNLRDLLIYVPSFDIQSNMKALLSSFERYKIPFLDDPRQVLSLLVDDNEDLFQRVAPFLPGQNDVDFCQGIINIMEKPLQKTDFQRFIAAYATDSRFFINLLNHLNDHGRANECWNLVPKEQWDKWYAGAQHGAKWANTADLFGDIAKKIEFFDKLTSDHQLTAEEFCALSPTTKVWDSIPDEQWQTWIKDNKLPSNTKTFLSLLPFSLRLSMFTEMLKPSWKEDVFKITEDKTIADFFPDEVITIGAASSSQQVTALISKIQRLKLEKINDFKKQVADVVHNLTQLELSLNHLLITDMAAPKVEDVEEVEEGWLPTMIASLYQMPGYVLALVVAREDDSPSSQIKRQVIDTQALLTTLLPHPFLTEAMNPILDTGELFTQLQTHLEKLGTLLKQFADKPDANEMPKNFKDLFIHVTRLYKDLEDMGVVALEFERDRTAGLKPEAADNGLQDAPMNNVSNLRQFQRLIQDLNQQFDKFYAYHHLRFFQSPALNDRSQAQLARQIDYLVEHLTQLERLAEQPEVKNEMKDKLEEYQQLLTALKTKHQSFQAGLGTTILMDPHKTKSTNNDEYLTQFENQMSSFLERCSIQP